ncbi:hypothetical protein ACQ5SO_09020 [Rhodovulum sp. DZ06]|uniref:hypothetical protein n=1 Tax=Rhodovulum sp. DZ06 TaxID=3425126 RepID=UPI003D33C61C
MTMMGHNRRAALAAELEAARAERERLAEALRRAEAARPRAGRTAPVQVEGLRPWAAGRADDAGTEALRAASLALAAADEDFGALEEELPFPLEEMGFPEDAPGARA